MNPTLRRWSGLGIAVGSSLGLLGLTWGYSSSSKDTYEADEVESNFPETPYPPESSQTRPAESTFISPHFTLGEFAQRARFGLPRTPYPTIWIVPRLYPLVRVLEKIRNHFNTTVKVTSAYRTPAYNQALAAASNKVAKDSQHMYGRAADIKVYNVSPCKVQEFVRQLRASGDTSIGGLGSYPTFTHVDVRPVDRLQYWGHC